MRRLFTLLAGVAAFIAGKTLLGFGIFLSIILALTGIVAMKLIWPKRKPGTGMSTSGAGSAISASEAHRVITRSTDKVREIRAMTIRIRDNSVAEEVRGICRVAMDIIENFKKDPSDIRRARQFVHYYLDATVKIVNRYTELSNSKVSTPEIAKSLEKTEELLKTMKGSFEKQLQQLLENDVLDLDTEVELLKKTLKMEGM